MHRRRESLHAVYRDLSRQLEEARQILARIKNPHIDNHRSGGLEKDVHQSVVDRIDAAQIEHDRLLQLRDDAADQQRRYGESIQGCLDWAEDRMKQPGMGQPRINVGGE